MTHLNGVLVVDKPENISSAGAVGILKRMLKAKKIGHTGTLDPFATGVLVCCINKATRLAKFFLKSNKTYEAVLVLGASTDTQDRTGRIVATSNEPDVTPEMIQDAFNRFVGPIHQRPPVYSALKHKGVPLYKLARSGKTVQKPARAVSIHRLDLLHFHLPEVRFRVHCSAGTYIRTLCADIGDFLGCGGFLRDLRRIESGGFTIDEALSLDGIEAIAESGRIDECVISMKDALKTMPTYIAGDELAEKIKNGRVLHTEDVKLPQDHNGLLKIVDNRQLLLAVVECGIKSNHYAYCCVLTE
ncbi:MAG: tRNA pseudouridine(55) synthase TruB [Desulfobacterales bacterium]